MGPGVWPTIQTHCESSQTGVGESNPAQLSFQGSNHPKLTLCLDYSIVISSLFLCTDTVTGAHQPGRRKLERGGHRDDVGDALLHQTPLNALQVTPLQTKVVLHHLHAGGAQETRRRGAGDGGRGAGGGGRGAGADLREEPPCHQHRCGPQGT
jgi:hypothetical protein